MSLLARLVPAGSILVVGIGVATLTRILITRVLRRVLPAQEGGPLQPQSAANGVFWFLVLVTVIISLSLLAPTLLTDVPGQLIRFLPKLGTALVMLWLAALAAGLVRGIAEGMLRRMNVAAGPLVAKSAYWAILGLGILMAADELGVQTAVLTTVLYILIFSIGLGTALALGLGAWRLASNVIAGRYVDDRFSVGEQIAVEDYVGTITDVGIASITIADRDGSMVEIPHRWLLDRPVRRSGL